MSGNLQVAEGSNLEALYAVEDSWGELASSYDVYNLRTTGFGINMSRDSFTSNELRSDRQTADSRTGMDNVSGDIPVELSYNAFDDLIASAMFSSWSADSLPVITIGTTQSSLRISRNFPAMGQYHEFLGCVVNSWSVSVQPNSIITSTFNFMGKGMNTYTTNGGYENGVYTGTDNTANRKLTGGSDKATHSPFDSFSGSLYVGAGSSDPSSSANEVSSITGIDFSVENALTSLQVVGNKQAVGVSAGRATVSGTVTAYFINSDMLNRFLNETETAILFTLTDASSQSYEFFMPRIRFNSGDLDVSGEGPVTISMPFTALVPSSGTVLNTLQIKRLAG
jgi:hypothetical protein